MPRVSVVMTVYNDERYVAEAIQSVLAQTYQDFELVITDNGSSDGTANVIKSFQDPRIRLLSLAKNRGHCGGMNNSIKAAKGEFLALLNSDDVFFKYKLEKQVNFLDKNSHIGIVFSYAEIIDKDSNHFEGTSAYKGIFDRPNQKNRFDWLSYFFVNNNCLCHPSGLIRKKCQEDIGWFDERYALFLDFDYWIRTCLKYEIYILPEELTKFRVHENQGSAEKPETFSLHDLELTQVLKHYLSPVVLNNLSSIFSLKILKQICFQKNMEEIDIEIEPLIISMLKDVHDIEGELKPFFVAMLAFWVGRASHRAFGLDILYHIYKNPKIVEQIKHKYSYDFSMLIKLAKAQDIFGRIRDSKLNTQLHSANKDLENLSTELNQVKMDLERVNDQSIHTQKDLEKVQRDQAGNEEIITNRNYNLLIKKAVDAYEKKDLSMMAQYLEESLEHTPLSVTETVLDWLESLCNFSCKKGNFDIYSLTKSEEWDRLMRCILKY
jgi:glycosyltransferase involved in cell wall biosynthesis